MTENKFPAGWDAARVGRLIAEYDSLSEEELLAGDEAAAETPPGHTLVAVPRHLLPAVERLIAADARD